MARIFVDSNGVGAVEKIKLVKSCSQNVVKVESMDVLKIE